MELWLCLRTLNHYANFTDMQANLVKSGDIVNVILPKAAVQQASLEEAVQVDISIEHGKISLTAAGKPHPRVGWEKQLVDAIASNGNVETTAEDWSAWQTTPNEFDKDEWTW